MARALLVATAMALVAACTSVRSERTADDARIWDVRAGQYISQSMLAGRLVAARFRLLGEVHDNPAHHALRAQMLGAIAAAGKHPAAVFEQFDVDNDRALVDAQRAGADAEALASAAALDRRSWGWPLHEPLVAAALEAGLPVRAGNISRRRLDAIARTGDLSSLDSRVRSLVENSPWDDRQQRVLDDEIEQGHCGKLPVSLVPRLALAQRVRDAALAAALMDDATTDGAVLIAGNGHVRGDLGVPVYLGAAASDTISVGWIELSTTEIRERDAGGNAAREHPGFDYLWLTHAVDRADPCATIPSLNDRTKAS